MKKKFKKLWLSFLLINVTIVFVFLPSCNNDGVMVRSGKLLFIVNKDMQTKVCISKNYAKEIMDRFVSSEYITASEADFNLFRTNHIESLLIADTIGNGKLIKVTGTARIKNYTVDKQLEIIAYDSFPNMVLIRVKYFNTGKNTLHLLNWVNNNYKIESRGDNPAFWSFQPSSSSERADWVLPVYTFFIKRNFMGMNNTDYGGGIPIIDLWRSDVGVTIGHVELTPKEVSLVVKKNEYDTCAQIGIEYDYSNNYDFKPGDSICTYTTFVSIHKKDFYNGLEEYSKFMQAKGIKFITEEPSAFEPVWCAWGYMRKFTLNEIEGTLPKVKELGLKWVDIDDGYQQAIGDWSVADNRFPGGENGIKNLVRKIHAMGLKAKIWWSPLAVSPYSELYKMNPDIILQTIDGAPQYITWWNSYYMSPVYDKTREITKNVLKKFLSDWDFDGLKMDGQHLNCVPPDFNPAHHLMDPEESFEKLPEFYKMIYNTAISYKPHAVLQICPCGCAVSFFNIPYMNQAVASDPTSSWQIRLKCKTYKAIRPGLAYYGDHVELSDGGNDFASQLGVGAVLGTKFTWPEDNPYVTEGKFVLTPENEKIWKKWISLYNQKMLSTGKYLGNLYDIGYDKPEAHVIQKNDTLFYAFYNEDWKGIIELRGLTEGKNIGWWITKTTNI